MDSENKQRISLYLDKDTVKKADKMMKEHGYRSRNEFYTAAMESFIADELLQENDSVLSEKLARAVAELSENNAKAISKGLFRYAVQLSNDSDRYALRYQRCRSGRYAAGGHQQRPPHPRKGKS